MSESSKSSGSIWTRGPFWFGVLLSVIVIGFGSYSLTSWPVCGEIGPCMSNWDQLRFRSTPNEIGDMLAGFAGALAFIWIVVTVLLQAAELREQREQFQKMATAQEAQATLLEKQGTIFEDEKKFRDSIKIDELVEENMRFLAVQMNEHRGVRLSWRVDFNTKRWGLENLLEIRFAPEVSDIDDYDKVIRFMSRKYGEAFEVFRPDNIIPDDAPEMRPAKPKGLSEMVLTLEGIVQLSEGCSEAERLRISNLGVYKILNLYKRLDSDSRYWKPESTEE